jgi:hypothetical protein
MGEGRREGEGSIDAARAAVVESRGAKEFEGVISRSDWKEGRRAYSAATFAAAGSMEAILCFERMDAARSD